jgi:hypothetical protein
MAKTVDAANGNTSAQDVYRRLYVPLSNFTVHASGGTLMRHVRRNDRLATVPSRAWNRRSAARVADAAAGILAAAIADNAGLPYDELAAYAARHEQRALMPVAFIGITGLSGTVKPGQLLRAISLVRQLYDYLWHGAAASDTLEARTAHVAREFKAMLDARNLDLPPGTLDPFINYVADKLAREVDEAAGS